MEHRIEFDPSFDGQSILSREDVRDVIETFYRFAKINFHVTCISKGEKPGTRGSHIFRALDRTHVVYLSPKTISDAFKTGQKMGGNTTQPTLKMAMVSVLVHELQHANQVIIHSGYGSVIHKRVPFQRYSARACERDARSYVDDNLDKIAAFCGIKLNKGLKGKKMIPSSSRELEDLIDVLRHNDSISMDEIVEELRSIKMNNARNVSVLVKDLTSLGVKIEI